MKQRSGNGKKPSSSLETGTVNSSDQLELRVDADRKIDLTIREEGVENSFTISLGSCASARRIIVKSTIPQVTPTSADTLFFENSSQYLGKKE
jgi:hypothetical protein